MLCDFKKYRIRFYLAMASLAISLMLACVIFLNPEWPKERLNLMVTVTGLFLAFAAGFKLAARMYTKCSRCRKSVLPFIGGFKRIRAILRSRPVVCAHCHETVETD
jgi:hypothetical protein